MLVASSYIVDSCVRKTNTKTSKNRNSVQKHIKFVGASQEITLLLRKSDKFCGAPIAHLPVSVKQGSQKAV